MRFLRRWHRHRCEARTVAGKRCKAAPLEGTTRCLLHTKGNAQRLASSRWSRASGVELDRARRPGTARVSSPAAPERDSHRLPRETHTRPRPPKTNPTRGPSTDDLLREIDAVYPRREPPAGERPAERPTPAAPPGPSYADAVVPNASRNDGETTADFWARSEREELERWRKERAKALARLPYYQREAILSLDGEPRYWRL
jgi:hypothetical protein